MVGLRTMEKQRIIIVGSGNVGLAVGEGLMTLNHEVIFYDKNMEVLDKRKSQGYVTATAVKDAGGFDLAMVCVNTNTDSLGNYNLANLSAAIHEILTEITRKKKETFIGIKSTTFPGSLSLVLSELFQLNPEFKKYAKFASIPEFLRERCALQDFLGSPVKLAGAEDASARVYFDELLTPFCEEFISFDNFETAEIIKIVHNLANSNEILFWNQCALVFENFGVTTSTVKNIVQKTAESRTNPAYAWGRQEPLAGSCLPKDLRGSFTGFNSLNLDSSLLKGLIEFDNFLIAKKTNRDS